jgi:hypothetical protein
MNTTKTVKSIVVKIGLLIFISALLQACGGKAQPATTLPPRSTYTPTAIVTSTMAPTSTPVPTATDIPTSTPAPLGKVVRNGSLEITVMDVNRHDNLIPGNGYRYWAKTGYIIIDLIVKLQNTGSDPASLKWSDLYVIDGSGYHRDLLFGGSQKASKKERVNPLAIDYQDVNGRTEITVSDTVYMRAIFIITDKPQQSVLFGIGDSPLIGFTVKR